MRIDLIVHPRGTSRKTTSLDIPVYMYIVIYIVIYIHIYIYDICTCNYSPQAYYLGKHRQKNPKRHVLNKKVMCLNYTEC